MEEMRRIRNLKRQLEAEYNIENAYELAEALVNTGATEMTDDIREKIHYLQQICKDIALTIIGLLLCYRIIHLKILRNITIFM